MVFPSPLPLFTSRLRDTPFLSFLFNLGASRRYDTTPNIFSANVHLQGVLLGPCAVLALPVHGSYFFPLRATELPWRFLGH